MKNRGCSVATRNFRQGILFTPADVLTGGISTSSVDTFEASVADEDDMIKWAGEDDTSRELGLGKGLHVVADGILRGVFCEVLGHIHPNYASAVGGGIQIVLRERPVRMRRGADAKLAEGTVI